MKVTYYGHACFAVELASHTLLFDPFITPNDLAKNIDIKAIRAQFILISHGHMDHLADAVQIAGANDATVITNFEIAQWLGKQGISKLHPMNLGGSQKFDFGRVKYVNAIHSSSLPDGSYGGNPGGFVVQSSEGDFYYSGDTALTMDMKDIGESYRLSWAALCIGDNFTMGVSDAVKAAERVNCSRVLGVHYDTFPPIKIDHAEAAREFKKAGRQLHLVPIGGSLTF